MQQETSVFIYEELGDCRRKYLGVVAIGSSPVTIALPLETVLAIELGKGSRSLLTSYSTSAYETMTIRPKAHVAYQLEYRERDGSSELRLRQRSGEEPWEDVSPPALPACEHHEYVARPEEAVGARENKKADPRGSAS